jgi:hypothetical protein
LAEAYATIAGRQQRLSSLALADRRTGAARGLVADGRLLPTARRWSKFRIGPRRRGFRAAVCRDFSNIAFRGIGWGADGAGRAITLRLRARF